MTDKLFDLSFDGTLLPGAELASVRQRLGILFKLDEQGANLLFSGKSIVIKRQVTAATAASFERAFTQAGAVLRIISSNLDSSAVNVTPTAESPESFAAPSSPSWTLAPLGSDHETPPLVQPPKLDLSSFSLITGNNWDLNDCAPVVVPTPIPDLSHLKLE